jgi:hypothetical protein
VISFSKLLNTVIRQRPVDHYASRGYKIRTFCTRKCMYV